MKTSDCIKHINNLIRNKSNLFQPDEYTLSLFNDGQHPWIGDGTNKKDWKRHYKKTIGNTTFRIFRPDVCIYKCLVLVHEENNQITNCETFLNWEEVYKKYNF